MSCTCKCMGNVPLIVITEGERVYLYAICCYIYLCSHHSIAMSSFTNKHNFFENFFPLSSKRNKVFNATAMLFLLLKHYFLLTLMLTCGFTRLFLTCLCISQGLKCGCMRGTNVGRSRLQYHLYPGGGAVLLR